MLKKCFLSRPEGQKGPKHGLGPFSYPNITDREYLSYFFPQSGLLGDAGGKCGHALTKHLGAVQVALGHFIGTGVGWRLGHGPGE